MKARFRKSPATSGGFEIPETSRSAAFSADIRVFASTSGTTIPVGQKINCKVVPTPLGAKRSNIMIQAAVHTSRKTG